MTPDQFVGLIEALDRILFGVGVITGFCFMCVFCLAGLLVRAYSA